MMAIVRGGHREGGVRADVPSVVSEVLAEGRVVPGDNEDYWHDEALGATPQQPACVVFPETTDEVAAEVADALSVSSSIAI